MKKKLFSVLLSSILTLSLAHSAIAADTPLLGYKWNSNVILYANNGTNTFYKNIWTTAEDEWNDATDITMSSYSTASLTAGNKSVPYVTWDGIMEPVVSNGKFTSAKVWVNTYYTTQSAYVYEPNAIQSIATHEFGHALGLAHAPERTFSVMVPATFFSDGTFARFQYFPGIGDENAVNNLYFGSSLLSKGLETQEQINEAAIVADKDLVDLEISWSKWYLNLEHLAADADLVVKAKVKSKDGTIVTGENFYDYKQKSQINIQKVLKGDSTLKSKDISIYQMGGETQDALVKYHGTTALNKNDIVILYLKKIGENEYIPINEDVSIYKADSTGKYVNLQSQKNISELEIIQESKLN